jgi:hypothetical protein
MNVRGVVVASLLIASNVLAATPFGGDDTGFIPPSRGVFVCASKSQILVAKLIVGLTKCHIRLAAAGLAGNASGNSEEGCENATKSKFLHATGGVLSTGCPLCVVQHINFEPIATTLEAQLDAANGSVFCAGATPLGDDDTGFVPPDSTTYRCEGAVAKALSKLRYCLAKCHAKYAKAAMSGALFDEEACESTDVLRSCRAKFDKVRDKVAPTCPGCLDASAQNGLADGVEADVDQTNDLYYCESPSGAFVDAGR